MAKVLKSVALGAVLIGISFLIPPAGISIAAGMTITSGALLAAGITGVLSGLATVAFAPKTPPTQLSRLNVSLDTTTPRKAVFGTTAMPLDLRYHEVSGTDQEYVDYIIATAAHKVTSIDQIWFDDKMAWSSAGGVTSTYNGYLTVEVRTEGTAANTIAINGGTKWGSSRRLTGCAYVYLRIKRTGITKKAESPLVNGLPSRVTVKGNGALLYDPRKDSTVTGGSGTHRANDQSTWGVYTDPDDCDNPALQLLWWLLGWKINGVLSVGCGVPPARIDMQSFITAANICDENITLAAGGTQKRYRTSGTAADSDDRMSIINTFLSSMNGTLRDNDGKLTLTVMKNDLADYVLTFDDNDILDSFEWNQTRGLTETYNVARGRYVDPSDSSLYQMVDYPEVRIASPDGIERVMTVDLPYVEEGRRAQRIAKQVLQRNQYRGMFSATFTAKALGCQVGDVVRLTFSPLGWTNKLFRVVSQNINMTGQVPLALIEENAAIYAWDANETALVTPVEPTIYNPLNDPFIQAIDEIEGTFNAVVNLYQRTATNTAPAVSTTGTATYNIADNTITGQPTGWTIGVPDASLGAYIWVIQAPASSTTTTASILNTAWSAPVILAENGTDGTNGTSAISGYLTNEAIALFAYANGNVVSYAPATGSFVIVSGNTNISSSFSLSVPSGGNPQGLTVSLVNQTYTITGGFDPAEDTALLTIRATGSGAYTGITLDKVVSLSKMKGGYEIVATLPSTNLFEGRMVFLTSDDKLYRYTGTAWTAAVPAVDITGTITETQIANDAITSPKIAANAVTASEIAANAVTADKINANAVTADKIQAGAVTAAKISVTELSAISATMGEVTAGLIRNSSSTMKVDLNTGHIIISNGTYMKVSGNPFGDSNQFIEWFGPVVSSLSLCTIANAIYYLRTNGDAYYSGTLAASMVKTVNIENEAVTTKTYSFTSGSINVPSGGYTYVQVQTATITTTGEDVEIDGYFELDVLDNCKYQYRFLRGGSPLLTLGPITVNTADGPPAFFRYVDSPAAGTYTYTVEVACNDANNINVLNRGLSLKEIKR